VAMLHEAATGGMRDLDRFATGCLREAARKKVTARPSASCRR
jgi:hypothetical protein